MGDVSLIIRVLFSWLVFLSQSADAAKPAPGLRSYCPEGWYFPHPNFCHKFIQCTNGKSQEMPCAVGLWWNAGALKCVSPWDDKICRKERVVMCHFRRYTYTGTERSRPRTYLGPSRTGPPMLHLSADVEYPCTHLVYGYNIFIRYNQINLLGKLHEDDKREIARMKLKPGPNRMRTLLSVKLVDWKFDIDKFTANVPKQLRANSFDGIEIDFGELHHLYIPNKIKFSKLLKSLRKSFQDEAKRSKRTLLEISTTVYPREKYIGYYDVKTVSTYADYVVVNAMHTDWWNMDRTLDPRAVEPSPLYNSNNKKRPSQNTSVTAWLKHGLARNKLIVPSTTYAVDQRYCIHGGKIPICVQYYRDQELWSLDNGYESRVPYFELCRLKSYDYKPRQVVGDKDLSKYLHPGQSVPYENTTTVLERVEYIKKQGLRGTKVYFLQFDDHSNRCGEGRFPLTNLAFEKLVDRKVDMEPKETGIIGYGHLLPPYNGDSVGSSLSALVVLMVICVHWVAGH